jgi:hypothetical protein
MWREPDTSTVLPLPTSRQIRRLLIWLSSPADPLIKSPERARVEPVIASPAVSQLSRQNLRKGAISDSLDQ